MSTTPSYAERQAVARPTLAVSFPGAFAGGAIAGVIGGVMMAMTAMFRAWSTGMGFWLPVKNIAATFLGVEALIGGAAAILAGLMTHMIVSAVWGGVFGIIGGARTSAGRAFLLGVLWGGAVWVLMTFIGLPLVNEVMAERVALQPGWFFFYHLVFGAMLFLTPLIARAFDRSRA